jgi:hypothetical protein
MFSTIDSSDLSDQWDTKRPTKLHKLDILTNHFAIFLCKLKEPLSNWFTPRGGSEKDDAQNRFIYH